MWFTCLLHFSINWLFSLADLSYLQILFLVHQNYCHSIIGLSFTPLRHWTQYQMLLLQFCSDCNLIEGSTCFLSIAGIPGFPTAFSTQILSAPFSFFRTPVLTSSHNKIFLLILLPPVLICFEFSAYDKPWRLGLNLATLQGSCRIQKTLIALYWSLIQWEARKLSQT